MQKSFFHFSSFNRNLGNEWESKTVFDTFQCRNFEGYHNSYLKCDTILLACVFEDFRRLCMNTYGLDSANHYSASNSADDAFLKICWTNIQLLTNRKHLEIVKNMIRAPPWCTINVTSRQTTNTHCAQF